MSAPQNLEEQLINAKAQSEKGVMIEKLLSNRDFRKIILDDFCQREVVRNMNMAGNPGTPKEMQDECVQAAFAGGHLKRYLDAQVGMGRVAAKEVINIQEQIEEDRAEPEGVEGSDD